MHKKLILWHLKGIALPGEPYKTPSIDFCWRQFQISRSRFLNRVWHSACKTPSQSQVTRRLPYASCQPTEPQKLGQQQQYLDASQLQHDIRKAGLYFHLILLGKLHIIAAKFSTITQRPSTTPTADGTTIASAGSRPTAIDYTSPRATDSKVVIIGQLRRKIKRKLAFRTTPGE